MVEVEKKIKKDFSVEVLVADLKGNEGEGDGIFIIENTEIICFLPDWRGEGWFDMESGKICKSPIGKKVKIFLSLLLTQKPKKSTTEIKKLYHDVFGGGDNPHLVMGEIIRILPKNFLIIDCGVPIYISYGGNEFNVGDYIQAEGRLDAYKVE